MLRLCFDHSHLLSGYLGDVEMFNTAHELLTLVKLGKVIIVLGMFKWKDIVLSAKFLIHSRIVFP